MAHYGKTSRERLATVSPLLRLVAYRVIPTFDLTVPPFGGRRTPAEQKELVASGASKRLDSLHVAVEGEPADALDLAPCVGGKIPWPVPGSKRYFEDLHLFYFAAGRIVQASIDLGIELVWGGDWDRDNDLNDQKFNDLVHFELLNPEG